MKKMKTMFALFALAVASLSVSAEASYTTSSAGFVAPVISGTSNVPYPARGEIIFDNSAGKFKGYNGTSWVPLDNEVKQVNAATIAAAENASEACDGDCAVYRATGSWISSVVRNAAGIYTVNFTTSYFASAPNCVATGVGDGVSRIVSSPAQPSTSSWQFYTRIEDGTNTDSAVSIICIAP